MVSGIEAVQAQIAQFKPMLEQQAQGVAQALSLAGPGKTLGDYMVSAHGNVGMQAPIHQLNNSMNSLQLGVDTTKDIVTVDKKSGNSLALQTTLLQKSPELKDVLKIKGTKEYYNYLEVPLIEATKRMSLYAQAVFEARAKKPTDITAAAKKQLVGAVSSLVKAKKYANDPNRAQDLAEYAGILKGLVEASNVQSVVSNYATLDKELAPLFAETGKTDVYNQTAQRIIEASKQQQQQPGPEQGLGGPMQGRQQMPPQRRVPGMTPAAAA